MEGIHCVLCLRIIDPNRPAYAVKVTPSGPEPPPHGVRIPRRAWICTPHGGCDQRGGLTTTTYGNVVVDQHDSPSKTVSVVVNPPKSWTPVAPCEGCGRTVALPVDVRRTRIACSTACLIRISPSHRNRATSVTVMECQTCGGPMPGTRPGRRYCSSTCKQRAYRGRRQVTR